MEMLTSNSYRRLTNYEMEIAKELAKIEQEDEDRCKSCGGEDCICCEYYLDRQKWVEPDELFGWNNELIAYD